MSKKIRTVKYDVTNSGRKITPVAFLKFGSELGHLVDLLENGNLYLNTMQVFREGNDEEDEYTNDPFEGATSYMKVGPGTASTVINDQSLSFNFLELEVEPVNYYEGNIACFYSITTDCFENGELLPVDIRMTNRYTHFLFIKNPHEFISRFTAAIDILEISCRFGYVEYFPQMNHSGELHPHNKRSKYEFQNEFRLFLKTEGIEPLTLKLGPLTDIAEIYPVELATKLRGTILPSKDGCSFRFES